MAYIEDPEMTAIREQLKSRNFPCSPALTAEDVLREVMVQYEYWKMFGYENTVGALANVIAWVTVGDWPQRPRIVCLCGSTRFYHQYVQANYDFTMQGMIVLTVGFFHHAKDEAHGETVGITPAQKGFLDQLHLRKIDLADEVFVINVGGYIGQSTANEIAYAEKIGKPVRYLES